MSKPGPSEQSWIEALPTGSLSQSRATYPGLGFFKMDFTKLAQVV
jgi:hypothetical protein